MKSYVTGGKIQLICFWLSILGLRKFSSLNLMMNVDAHDVCGRVDDNVDVERL